MAKPWSIAILFIALASFAFAAEKKPDNAQGPPFPGSIGSGDPTTAGRMTRDGNSSICPYLKACPGALDAATAYHYHVESFTNFSGASCISVRIDPQTCGSGIFAAVYSPSFVPTNMCTNYVGDAGGSIGTPQLFDVDVTPGATFDVVVWEVTANTGCAGYNFNLTAEGANGLARSDFTLDGLSDLLLQSSTGTVAQWQMGLSSGIPVITAGAAVAAPGSDWKVVATGDFNADGINDVVLQSASRGDIAIWLMNGFAVSSGAIVATPGIAWKVVGTGDFDADGHSDLILQNSSNGDVAIWRMNGTSIVQGGIVGSPGTAWKVITSGDFNFDGYDDLLLQNSSSGDIAEWQLHGLTLIAGGLVSSPGASWKLIAAGDFDANGFTDAVLQNTATGDVAIWRLNGFTVAAGGIAASPGTGWSVVGTTSSDRNGMSDLVLRQPSTGAVGIWLMNGGTVVYGTVVGNPGTAYVPIVN